jgi:hypothetical protein
MNELTSTVLDSVRYLPNDKRTAIFLDTPPTFTENVWCGVLRLFPSNFGSLSRADMELKSKIFSRFISRRWDYCKGTRRRLY